MESAGESRCRVAMAQEIKITRTAERPVEPSHQQHGALDKRVAAAVRLHSVSVRDQRSASSCPHEGYKPDPAHIAETNDESVPVPGDCHHAGSKLIRRRVPVARAIFSRVLAEG